jgi:hypothetical protein
MSSSYNPFKHEKFQSILTPGIPVYKNFTLSENLLPINAGWAGFGLQPKPQ